jgi:hypothetical protein
LEIGHLSFVLPRFCSYAAIGNLQTAIAGAFQIDANNSFSR